MNYEEKEKLSANKKIYLFKWFIKFLEIYGQETFGESASINWGLVHDEIIGHNVWSMNMELDNLLYNDSESLDSEEFRDKVFSYIEDQVIKGYPIFRLFYLPEKLKKYYEDEIKQNIYENDKKRFAKYKCFKCKHYCDKIKVYVGDPGMNIMGVAHMSIDTFKERYPDADIASFRLTHRQMCDLFEKYFKEFEDEETKTKGYVSYSNREQRFNNWIDKREYAKGVKFPKDENYNNELKREYELKPLLNRCKCNEYEPIENFSFDDFLKKYMELPY